MTPGQAAAVLPVRIDGVRTGKIQQEIESRTPRAANALRNAELNDVLRGPSPSAPGNPPGVRSGFLRISWTMFSSASSFGIESGAHYAGYLEHGTRKMAARPFVDKIQQTAMPNIVSIFSEIGG